MTTLKLTVDVIEFQTAVTSLSRVDTFHKAHGDKTVRLSEALESNGVEDLMQVLSSRKHEISASQSADLANLAVKFAADTLQFYNSEYVKSAVCRNTIKAAESYADDPRVDDRVYLRKVEFEAEKEVERAHLEAEKAEEIREKLTEARFEMENLVSSYASAGAGREKMNLIKKNLEILEKQEREAERLALKAKSAALAVGAARLALKAKMYHMVESEYPIDAIIAAARAHRMNGDKYKFNFKVKKMLEKWESRSL